MRQVYFSGLLASLVPFWFFPATQIIENLPAGLFPPSLQSWPFTFGWPLLLCAWILLTPQNSKFVVGAFLLGLVDFGPLLRAKSLQWEEVANQVFLREREGGVRAFAP